MIEPWPRLMIRELVHGSTGPRFFSDREGSLRQAREQLMGAQRLTGRRDT